MDILHPPAPGNVDCAPFPVSPGESHGSHMEVTWKAHGSHMKVTWKSHGGVCKLHGRTWKLHERVASRCGINCKVDASTVYPI